MFVRETLNGIPCMVGPSHRPDLTCSTLEMCGLGSLFASGGAIITSSTPAPIACEIWLTSISAAIVV